MSLWVDKYKPKTIDQLTYHNDLSKRLKKLVRLYKAKRLVIIKVNMASFLGQLR